MELYLDPSFPLVILVLLFALIILLLWIVYGQKRGGQRAIVRFGCKKCGSNKLVRIDAGGQRFFQCKTCGAGFSDPVEQFSLEQDPSEKDPEKEVKKRICPICGSSDIFPDQVAGALITWTCRKCHSTFPSAIEIYEKK